ncbi:MAG: DUF2294 family protein [Chloroflexi bacterium]|nr:DUF2294 family protein [Chloroflexota bacterium]
MASIQTEAPWGGSKAAAISNHVVRTMSEYTGRGPTKARTHINDDVVTVILRDTLTERQPHRPRRRRRGVPAQAGRHRHAGQRRRRRGINRRRGDHPC